MVTYTVKYKLSGASAWKTITNVGEDGFNDYGVSRYFILANNKELKFHLQLLFSLMLDAKTE